MFDGIILWLVVSYDLDSKTWSIIKPAGDSEVSH